MYLPAESMLVQEWTRPHGQYAGLRPAWLLQASECWHGTDNGTDRQQDENIMPLLQAVYGITAVERTFPKFVYDDNN